MELFENYDRRIDGINEVLKKYDFDSLEECKVICENRGVNPYKIVKDTQSIAFEDAAWAYVLGGAIAIKKELKKANEIARALGEGLQAFCIPGSVADSRNVGIGHGNLGDRKSTRLNSSHTS